MTGDALQRFAPGQGLGTLRADTMNALVDAAKIVRAKMSKGQTGGRFQPLRQGPGSLEVLIRNDTGATLSERSVVELTTPLADPLIYGLDNQERPAFAADAPTGATSSIAVTVDPLGDGDFGRAVVLGVAVADLSVVDAGHEFCGPTATETGFLTTSTTGPIRILWKESGTGNKLGIVLLQEVGSGGAENTAFGGVTVSNLHDLPLSGFPSGYSARDLGGTFGTGLTVSDSVRIRFPMPALAIANYAIGVVCCQFTLWVGTITSATRGVFVVEASPYSGSGEWYQLAALNYPHRDAGGDSPAYLSGSVSVPFRTLMTAGDTYADVPVNWRVTFFSDVTWTAGTPPFLFRACASGVGVLNAVPGWTTTGSRTGGSGEFDVPGCPTAITDEE
jgi:hypothetical protein